MVIDGDLLDERGKSRLSIWVALKVGEESDFSDPKDQARQVVD